MSLDKTIEKYIDNQCKEFEKLSPKDKFKDLLKTAPNEFIKQNLIQIGIANNLCDKEGNIIE